MDPATTTYVYQILDLVTNMSVIVVVVKLIRHITRMELKVEIMWERFKRLFDIREDDRKKAGEL